MGTFRYSWAQILDRVWVRKWKGTKKNNNEQRKKNTYIHVLFRQKRPFLEMSIFQAIFPTILWFERIARSHRIHGIFRDISNHSGFVEKQSKLTQYAIKHPPNITVTNIYTHTHTHSKNTLTPQLRNATHEIHGFFCNANAQKSFRYSRLFCFCSQEVYSVFISKLNNISKFKIYYIWNYRLKYATAIALYIAAACMSKLWKSHNTIWAKVVPRLCVDDVSKNDLEEKWFN